MRLFVVGHSYVTAFAQAKYAAMKRLHPDLALRIIIPADVHHVFGRHRAELAEGLTEDEVVIVRRIAGRSHMTYVFDPVGLARAMRAFGPTHVHIEEDPHSLVGAQAVATRRTCAPQARMSFFIWDNLARTPGFPLNLVKRGLTKLGFSATTLVVCGNREAQRLLPAKGYAGASCVLPQLGLTVPPPVSDKERHQLRERLLGEPTTDVLIGFVGRFVPEKGIQTLLESVQLLRPDGWRLVLVGDGPMKAAIGAGWQARLGERLVVLNAVPHGEVAAILAALDVFVLPSHDTPTWKEQFGVTLAQAMLAGLACVGSDAGAIAEVMGDTGVMVRPQDCRALAEAIQAFVDSGGRRRHFGQRARERALQRFTNEAVAAAQFDALASVTA